MFSILPDGIKYAMERYMGSGQGDSSGDDGTSSDSSDEENSGTSGIVAKALIGRKRVLYLTSLKHLCLDVIIENNPKLASSTIQKQVFKVMGEKHGEVLDLVLKEMWPSLELTDSTVNASFVRCSLGFLEMLLHKNLTIFNMGVVRENKDVKKMWTILPKACPNLKKIVHENQEITILPIKNIMQLKKLESIALPYYKCDDAMLEQLACAFPKLRVLKLTLDRPTAKGVAHLLKMKHLEKFVYRIRCGVSDQKRKQAENYVFNQCLENLPAIKVCRLHGYMSIDFSTTLQKIYKKHMKDGFTLKLESLHLKKIIGIPPERLPMVKKVEIEGDITCAKELATFSHLQKFSVDTISSKNANIILNKIGKQLKYLAIKNEYMNTLNNDSISTSDIVFDFYELFSMCPNLEDLVFSGSQFCENSAIVVSSNNFKCLKRVNITMYDAQGYQMPLPILEHILRAENLRLYWTRCLPKALNNVLNENNNKYFQKLEMLNLERIWVKNYPGYIKSLKSLISRAPRLHQLEIGCVNEGVKEFKRSGLKQLCQQIPDFKFLTDYDNGMFAF